MKQSSTLLFALFVLFAAVARAEFARVEGQEILGTDGKVLHVKGTNLGNWLVPEGW